MGDNHLPRTCTGFRNKIRLQLGYSEKRDYGLPYLTLCGEQRGRDCQGPITDLEITEHTHTHTHAHTQPFLCICERKTLATSFHIFFSAQHGKFVCLAIFKVLSDRKSRMVALSVWRKLLLFIVVHCLFRNVPNQPQNFQQFRPENNQTPSLRTFHPFSFPCSRLKQERRTPKFSFLFLFSEL